MLHLPLFRACLLAVLHTAELSSVAQVTTEDSAKALYDEAFEEYQHWTRSGQERALLLWARALEFYRKSTDRRGESRTLNNIGLVYADMGRSDSALAYYRQALPLARGSSDRAGEAGTLHNMGSVYRDLGRSDSALAYYRQALPVTLAAGDRAGEAATLNSIGYVYADFGRRDSALAYYRQALPVARAADRPAVEATTLNNIGSVYIDLGPRDSALAYLRQALRISREVVNDRPGEATTLNNIGTVYSDLEPPDSALAYFRQALAIYREVGNREGEAMALVNIGAVYPDRGLGDSALAYYWQGLPIQRAVGDHPGEAGTLHLIGQHFQALRDFARAVSYYDSSSAVYEAFRYTAGSDANAVSLGEAQRGLAVGWALAWLARAEQVGETESVAAGLAASERGRSQALLDLMRRSAVGAAGGAGLNEAVARPGADLAAEADSLLAPLRARHAVLLSYLVTADTLLVWILRPSGELRLARRAVSRDSLSTLIEVLRSELGADKARQHMARGANVASFEWDEDPGRMGVAQRIGQRRDPHATALNSLAALLLPAGLAADLPFASELVVEPHGVLGLVPFADLPVAGGEGPLGARYALRYAPSLAALAAAERRPGLPATVAARDSALAQALVVGNPAMPWVRHQNGDSLQLRTLPGAEEEARWVAARLNAAVLTGPRATETVVRHLLAGAPLVHLASHGLAYGSGARVRDSYVALAPDATQDGFLTMGEILDDPALQLRAELIVLSACQTGLGSLTQAEGMVGLQRTVLAKGARSVLVSLWSVSDAATALLMRRFYTHWLGDGSHPSKAEALRRAQQDVRNTEGFAHPRFWAAFQLVGAN
jgi:tetratricopeptide (TPR) repeat protein